MFLDSKPLCKSSEFPSSLCLYASVSPSLFLLVISLSSDTWYPTALTNPRPQLGHGGTICTHLLSLRSRHPEAFWVVLAGPRHLFFFFQTTVLCSCCLMNENLLFSSFSGFFLVQNKCKEREHFAWFWNNSSVNSLQLMFSVIVECFLDLLFFLWPIRYFFLIFYISWRLITLQYCSGFCHTLKWISHGFTCVPHPDPPSHLLLHPIPLGLPSAPGLSTCLMHPTWAGDLFHPR